MDVNQLTAALAGHDPDPHVVLDRLASKQRARRRRVRILSGAAALSAVLILSASVAGYDARTPAPPQAAQAISSSPAESLSPVENPWTTSGGPAGAECANEALPDLLARAHRHGASVVVAHGELTDPGRTAGAGFRQMRLRSIRTIAGPEIPDPATGWVPDVRVLPGSRELDGADPVWASDGGLFAIVWPAADGQHVANAPLLWVTPVVQGQVIFNDGRCWNTVGIPGRPYPVGDLAEIPGSGSIERARGNGFTAVSLSVVQELARR